MKPKGKVSHLVILAAAVTLFPLGLFTGYIAVLSAQEGSLLKNAPDLPPAAPSTGETPGRLKGAFYKVRGAVQGDLLNPQDFPEVKNALWYRVTVERRIGSDPTWRRDASGILASDRVKHITVSNVPVDVDPMTRLSLPLAEAYRPINDHVRYAVQSKPSPQGGVICYGFYQAGTLREGVFDRLLILSADHFEETIITIERKGLGKSVFLGGISFVFLALSFVIGRAAWLGQVQALS